jgi:hypothetical protein
MHYDQDRAFSNQDIADIQNGMLEWEPGSLAYSTLNQVLTNALSDMWRDCYRGGQSYPLQRARFQERLRALTFAATGEEGLV